MNFDSVNVVALLTIIASLPAIILKFWLELDLVSKLEKIQKLSFDDLSDKYVDIKRSIEKSKIEQVCFYTFGVRCNFKTAVEVLKVHSVGLISSRDIKASGRFIRLNDDGKLEAQHFKLRVIDGLMIYLVVNFIVSFGVAFIANEFKVSIFSAFFIISPLLIFVFILASMYAPGEKKLKKVNKLIALSYESLNDLNNKGDFNQNN